MVVAAAMLTVGGERAGAEIVDSCVVRAESKIASDDSPIHVGVDSSGRTYELTIASADGGPGVPWNYAVNRYTQAGLADTAYGTVSFGGIPYNPGMVVAADGTVTLASFETESRPEIQYRRIDPNGQMSIVRSFGRPGHYVSGVGSFDAGDRLLSGIVVVPNGGSTATVVVIDVDTGEVITETPVPLVGDVKAVSQQAFALEDGSVSIAGGPPRQLPIPATHHRPRITDLLDDGDSVVAVGSADVDLVFSIASTSRPMFARFDVDDPSTPQTLSIGEDRRVITAISASGFAVVEEPEVLSWPADAPPPLRDTDIVVLDLDNGERTVVASIEDELASGGRALPGIATQADGSSRIVSQGDQGSLLVFDLWGNSPTPPQPAALTGQVDRLYRAYFARSPESSGMQYWRAQRASGVSVIRVSDAFAGSPEFAATYGSLDDPQFVELVYRNVLGRSSDGPGRAFWIDALASGTTRGEVMAGFSDSAEFVAATSTAAAHSDSEGQIARLYRAYFKRDADARGFCYWAGEIERSGVDAVSAEFAGSQEFAETYGPLSDEEFVDLVYQNVLGRSPDAAGKDFWIDQLQRGASRGRVMTSFSESAEYLLKTDTLPPSP